MLTFYKNVPSDKYLKFIKKNVYSMNMYYNMSRERKLHAHVHESSST